MKDTTTFAGNIFAGSPLDRAGNARRDPAWVAAQAAAPDTLFLGLWRLKIPVVGNGLGWISGEEMRALAPAGAETVLLGIQDGLDGETDDVLDAGIAEVGGGNLFHLDLASFD